MFCGSWAVWSYSYRIRSFRAPVLAVRLDRAGLRVDRVQVPGSCRVDHVGRVVSRLPVQVGPVQQVRALDRVPDRTGLACCLDRVGILFACLDRGSGSVKKYLKTTISYCNSSYFMLQ